MRLSTPESRKGGWVLISVFLFLYGVHCCQTELTYALKGQVTTAKVTKERQFVRESRNGRRTPCLKLEYAFTEPSGVGRIGIEEVSLNDDAPHVGSRIRVQYVPGVDAGSRIDGHNEMMGVSVLLGLVAVGVLALWIRCRIREWEAFNAPQASGLFPRPLD